MKLGRRSTRFVVCMAVLFSLVALLCMTRLLNPADVFVYRLKMGEAGPIDFYGKVVDQAGTPIAGAKVNITIEGINRWYILGLGDLQKKEAIAVVTAADGTFSVRGRTGVTLRIDEIYAVGFKSMPQWKHRGALPATDPMLTAWGYNFGKAVSTAETTYRPEPAKPATFPLPRMGEAITIKPSRGGK